MAKLHRRAARPSDAPLLYRWANEADALAAKLRTSGKIPWDEHVEWFHRRLRDQDTRIWIAEIDGSPVGQVRIERRDEGLEIDIYVEPQHRGQGLADRMILGAVGDAEGTWPGLPLIARVRHENRSSRRLFERAGFQCVERKGDHVVYRLVKEA